ncbi:MAG: alpha/beta hydrolase-fold protein [Cyanobacteriota bacterium]|nr:alpha/beta hydrolase-fold protein [Cyanobacteriota bacterium]
MTTTGFLDQQLPSGAASVAGCRGVHPATEARTSDLFQIFVPRSYDPERSWPLVLFLHGAGEGGDDGLLQTEFQLGSAIRRHADLFEAIAVFPQQRPSAFWGHADLDLALRCLEQTCKSWNINQQGLLLCGVSSGATGAWALAARHPDRFAGLLVVSGMVGRTPAIPPEQAVVPPAVENPHRWLAQRLGPLPVWIHHGTADPLFPVQDARRIAVAMKQEGAPVRYSELPGFGHNVWDVAFYSEEVLGWLLQQRRLVAGSFVSGAVL